MMFKAIVCVAAGVVVGFALGGVPARRELAAVRKERDTLAARLARSSRPNLFDALLPGIGARGRMLGPDGNARVSEAAKASSAPGALEAGGVAAQAARPAGQGDVAVIGGVATSDPDRQTAAMVRDAPAEAAAEAAPDAARGDSPRSDGPRGERRRERAREMLANFEQLVTAQRARMAAARSALIEQAGLEGEELVRFDSAVTRMNGKLAGYGEEVIAQASSDEPPSPAQALGLGHDVSGILYEGQKELDALVGDKAEKTDGAESIDPSALEIWNYVDLEQWRPYVQDQVAAGSDAEGEGAAAAGAGSTTPQRTR